jgi:hypothetical protein
MIFLHPLHERLETDRATNDERDAAEITLVHPTSMLLPQLEFQTLEVDFECVAVLENGAGFTAA